jgi:hypothetical protein
VLKRGLESVVKSITTGCRSAKASSELPLEHPSDPCRPTPLRQLLRVLTQAEQLPRQGLLPSVSITASINARPIRPEAPTITIPLIRISSHQRTI